MEREGCGSYSIEAFSNPGSVTTQIPFSISTGGADWFGQRVTVRFRLAEADTDQGIALTPVNLPGGWNVDWINGSQNNGFYLFTGINLGQSVMNFTFFVNEATYPGGECVTVEVIDAYVTQIGRIPCPITTESDNSSTCPTKEISGLVYPRLACDDFGNPDVLVNGAIATSVANNNRFSTTAEVGELVSIDRLTGSLDWESNYINVQDLVALSGHLNNTRPFTNAYQYIAANTANFGFETQPVINNIDLSALQRAILNDDAFLFTDPDNWFQPINWYFPVAEAISQGTASPSALNYATTRVVTNQTTGYNFSAIRIGDIFAANNCRSIASPGGVGEVGPDKFLPRTLTVLATALLGTGTQDIEISTGAVDRETFGLSFGFDTRYLQVIGARYAGVELPEEAIFIDEKAGIVNLIAGLEVEDVATLNENLTLSVRVLQPIQDIKASLWLAYKPALNMSVAMSDPAIAYPIQLNFSGKAISTVMTSVASPNPFTDQVIITINSTIQGTASVALYDMTGKQLRQVSTELTSGINNISLTQTGDLPTGTYLYRIVTAEGDETSGKLLKH